MPVVHIGLNVTPDSYARLVTGEYVRCTGVLQEGAEKVAALMDTTEAGKGVRQNVERLAKQAIESKNVQAIAMSTVKSKAVQDFAKQAVDPKNLKRLAKQAKKSNNLYLAVGAIAVVGGATLAVKIANDRKKVAEQLIPACVPGFNQALASYLETAYRGRLDAGAVAVLSSRLREIEECCSDGSVKLALSTKLLAESAELFLDYTAEFAEANDFSFVIPELEDDAEPEESLSVLRNCLDAQLSIFEAAG